MAYKRISRKNPLAELGRRGRSEMNQTEKILVKSVKVYFLIRIYRWEISIQKITYEAPTTAEEVKP